MAYSSFKASTKQWSYYRSLTGLALPSGCSKSKASSLIAKALKGDIPAAPKDVVKVYAWRFSGLAAECLNEEAKAVKFAVEVNYSWVSSKFASLAEAETFARSRYPDGDISVSTGIREQYMD